MLHNLTIRYGIGFAIPSNTVNYVAKQILRYGRVRRPWLGVTLQSAGGPANASAPGILIVAVAPGGPAARAGLKPGDFLAAVDGHPVRRMADLTYRLEQLQVGQTVRVGILRGAAALTFQLHWAELPASRGASQFVPLANAPASREIAAVHARRP